MFSCCLLAHVQAALVDADKSLHLQVFDDGVEVAGLVELLFREVFLNLVGGLSSGGVEGVDDGGLNVVSLRRTRRIDSLKFSFVSAGIFGTYGIYGGRVEGEKSSG